MVNNERFKAILDGSQELYENCFDDDMDMTNFKFYDGQEIDYYLAAENTWITAKVEKTLDEMILAKVGSYSEAETKWLNLESNIAPHMAM